MNDKNNAILYKTEKRNSKVKKADTKVEKIFTGQMKLTESSTSQVLRGPATFENQNTFSEHRLNENSI